MTTITDNNLVKLQTWLSPNFPVGAFAFSHALEYAVETGDVHDCETLTRWVGGILTFGAGRIDASLFRAAYEAVMDDDAARLTGVVARADAQRGSSEMALESAAQGRAFIDTLLKVWPQPRLLGWRDELARAGREPAYAVALGVAIALADMPLRPSLVAYLNAFAANLVSAVVRLVPLGQTDGQRAVLALEETVVAAANAAIARVPDDLGGAALVVDWMSIKHETQYTRLFRS
ncbi:MAG: urease accessory protein UreF [Alphaproteobacteria bacterium]